MSRTLRALWGAGRLARFDKAGLAGFADGWNGARHSFLALAWAAPLLLMMVLAQRGVYAEIEFGAAAVTARLASALLGWLAFVLLLFPLTRLLGRQRKVLRFITVFNWTQLLCLLIQAPPILAGGFGLVDFSGYVILVLGFLLLVLIYKGYVAAVALEVGVLEAVFVVIAELVFDIGAELLLMRLFLAL